MRRIAIALTLLALVVGFHACAADAPTKPPSGGGGQSSALLISLFTSDANPKAGTCTLVEAVVSLNGASVPDGTGVSFTTDFGTFSQNGLPTVSVVTANGAAVTALCGPGSGSAKVKATATVAGKTGSATLTIVFQPDAGTLPFVSSCSPSVGSTAGGDIVTLSGGRFFGTTSTSRVQFTAGGITRDGIVTSVTANSVTVQTPGFPELTAPSTPAAIKLTLGTNFSSPVILSLPNCFTFGTTGSSTPSITAILPSSGTDEGNTRVTIIGSGFATAGGVQVFFGAVEATVVSTNFNQIIALSPPAFGIGSGNLNQAVQVTVKNITSGVSSNPVTFTYGPSLKLTSVDPIEVPSNGPFPRVTIFGQGFQAPVAVFLGPRPAIVDSVSATEIVVTPTGVLVTDCTDVTGAVSVTNINSGDSVTGLFFRYLVQTFAPSLSVSSPNSGDVSLGTVNVTLLGSSLSRVTKVTFGSKAAFFTIVSDGQITATVPDDLLPAPVCGPGVATGTEVVVETVDITVTTETGCTATLAQAFSYQRQCTAPPAP